MPKNTEVDKPHIGDKLRAAIKAKGVSGADVSREFDVTQATVSADWQKYGRIAKEHIPHLVEYFGLPYEYWLGDARVDKKIQDVMLHMLEMSEPQKTQVVKEVFSDKKPDGNHGSAPKRAKK